MKSNLKSRFGVGVALGLLVLAMGGCGAADESSNGAADVQGATDTQAEGLTRRNWRPQPTNPPPVPSTPPTPAPTPPDASDCISACTRAKACCDAVTDGPLCNFDPKCSFATDAGRLASTRSWCLVLTNTTISAWKSSQRTPPAACTGG